MKYRHLPLFGAAFALAISVTVASMAQSSDAGAIRARQAGFKQMAASSKAITVELRGDAPQQGMLAAQSLAIAKQARGMAGWFPRGSGAGAGTETRALEQVWADPARFAATLRQFQTATLQAALLARRGDIPGFRTAWKQAADSCRSCHANFRAP